MLEKNSLPKRRIVAAALSLLLAVPGTAAAGELAGVPSPWVLPETAPVLLAADMEVPVTPLAAATAGEAAEDTFHTRLFTFNKLHMVLGLGSVAAGLMAAASAPENEGGGPVDDSQHQAYAELATGLGIAAVGTGLVFHWEDFSFRDGLLDPDILHMLLGTLGTAGFLYAINTAPASIHTTAGPVGIVAMLAAIKIEW